MNKEIPIDNQIKLYCHKCNTSLYIQESYKENDKIRVEVLPCEKCFEPIRKDEARREAVHFSQGNTSTWNAIKNSRKYKNK